MNNAIETQTASDPPSCCKSSTASNPADVLNRNETGTQTGARITLSIKNMTCGSCASKVQRALQQIEGVHSALVNLAKSVARVQYDDGHTSLAAMTAALAAAGYEAKAADNVVGTLDFTGAPGWLKGPVLWGAGAAVAVIAFYLGLITLTSDWSNATYQFSEYGGWVIALAAGLSLQVGLFVRMRGIMAGMHAKGSGKGIAASGSMSGVAMALCCSHYLATLLPTIGLPFLSGAVAGLAEYQTIFFLIGVISNILGIAYLLRMMTKNGMIHFGAAYRLGPAIETGKE